MRKEFIEAKTRRQAMKAASWAADFVKVDGGYMAFESADDANAFKSQR